MPTKSQTTRQPVSNETGDRAATPSPQPQPKHDATTSRKAMTGADLLKAARPTNRLLAKQELMTTVSQQLAEVQDILTGDVEQQGRAEELSGSAAFRLWQGLVGGLLVPDEVTSILGNQFGWRRKGDAKQQARNAAEQSKTPFGYGETIRKRVTRAVKAHAFANGAEADNFFRPFAREDVAEYIEKMENNELSINYVYNELQEDRRILTANDDGPIDAAYDPRKVLKLVQKLSEEGAVQVFAENPNLLIAYASVTDVIEAITDALMARPDADEIISKVQAAPALEAVE